METTNKPLLDDNETASTAALLAEQLAQTNARLSAMTSEKEKYQTKAAQLDAELRWLKEQVNLLKHHRFGKASEKLSQLVQSQLFDEDELDELNHDASDEEAQSTEEQTLTYTRRKPQRQRQRYFDTSAITHPFAINHETPLSGHQPPVGHD